MDITDRIHCDNIVICDKDEIKRLKAAAMEQPLISKRFMQKFPLNYRKDPTDKNDYKFKNSIIDVRQTLDTLPTMVDHSSKMGSVKNQGNLGSCVGFAVTAMKEWQETIEHLNEVEGGKTDTRKGKEYDLSESWVYWKSKEIDPWPGEEGTSIRYAMQVLQKIGVPTESGWPYNDVNDINFSKPKNWAKLIAKWSLIDKYWRINNLTELKAALINGPVPIGIPCFYEIFFVGNDGLVPYPEKPDEVFGGHAICAVGYDNRTKLIKFKNSWGKDWGKNGYGFLPYKYIVDFLWDAWTCSDLSVTQEMLKGMRELT